MEFSMKEELATYSNASRFSFDKFSSMQRKIIDHCVHESMMSKDNITCIDFTYGKLLIKIDNGEIRYKFVPSKELENSIITTLNKDTEEFVLQIEKKLTDKMFKLYEDLI